MQQKLDEGNRDQTARYTEDGVHHELQRLDHQTDDGTDNQCQQARARMQKAQISEDGSGA